MLERLRSERRWQWAAYGKHPIAKDYFTIGQGFPLLNSFAGGMENGYQVLASKDNLAKARHSWRFWTREARRDNVVCGVIRDSSDSLGRPYPLLIIGTGPLKDWVGQWDLVPLACDNAWSLMEYISGKIFGDLRELEEEVQKLVPPAADWLGWARKREVFAELEPPRLDELLGLTSGLPERTECFVPVTQLPPRDRFELICLYHSFVKARVEGPPNTVFTGGTDDSTYAAFFRRPLAASDFIRLWYV
jgi:type VI secretion system protein VasJ